MSPLVLTGAAASNVNLGTNGTISGLAAGGLPDDSVVLADLSATGTASSSTFLRGDNAWAAVPAGGITNACAWRITSSFTGNADPLDSNWEEVDTGAYSTLGSGITESSGHFTFPSTGYWLIIFHIKTQHNGNTRYTQMALETTTNNSSYSEICTATCSQTYSGNSASQSAVGSHIIDCTDTANVKFRFEVAAYESSTTTTGDSNGSWTYFTALRLGDT